MGGHTVGVVAGTVVRSRARLRMAFPNRRGSMYRLSPSTRVAPPGRARGAGISTHWGSVSSDDAPLGTRIANFPRTASEHPTALAAGEAA